MAVRGPSQPRRMKRFYVYGSDLNVEDGKGRRAVYLARSVDERDDRLRTEGRERVARELQRYDHGLSDPLEDYLPEADRILSALFDEVVK